MATEMFEVFIDPTHYENFSISQSFGERCISMLVECLRPKIEEEKVSYKCFNNHPCLYYQRSHTYSGTRITGWESMIYIIRKVKQKDNKTNKQETTGCPKVSKRLKQYNFFDK